MREIALAQKQGSEYQSFDNFALAATWLARLIAIKDERGKAYYQHVDHLQIIPRISGGYHVVAIYHKVYLCKDEVAL